MTTRFATRSRVLSVVLGVLAVSTLLAIGRAEEEALGAALGGITRHGGVRQAMRVEIRRLPVEPAAVPLADEARRRAPYLEWLGPGLVQGSHVPRRRATSTASTSSAASSAVTTRCAPSLRTVSARSPLSRCTARAARTSSIWGWRPAKNSSGTARYADRRPFDGWLVVTQPADGRTASPWLDGAYALRPDADGHFEVRGLLPGPVEIAAVLPDRLRTPCARLDGPQDAPLDLVVDEDLKPFDARIVSPDNAVVTDAVALLWSKNAAGAWVIAGGRADADGRVRLLRTQGDLVPWVIARGIEPAATVAEGPPFLLRTTPAAQVTGNVREEESSKPARGACVHLVAKDQRHAPRVAVTDEAGRFAFRDVAAGVYWLHAAGGGWIDADPASVQNERTILPGHSLDVALRALRGQEVRVRVVDEKGQVQPDVEVSATQSYIKAWWANQRLYKAAAPAVTNADGWCQIGSLLPDKPVSLSIEHPRLILPLKNTGRSAIPGEDVELVAMSVPDLTGRVALPPGLRSGRIRVEYGPLKATWMPGAEELPPEVLARMGGQTSRITLRPDGSFRLEPWVFGPHRVHATAWTDDVLLEGTVTVEPGAPEPTLRLQPTEPKTAWLLRVLDPEGGRVPGGYAAFAIRGPGHFGNVRRRIQDGEATVECEQEGATVNVTLYGFTDQAGQPLPYANHEAGPLEPGVHTVRLKAGRLLRVQVTDSAGRPIAGADVVARGTIEGSGPGARGTTDEAGKTVLLGLESGAVRVEVSPPPLHVAPAPMEIEDGTEEATVVITPFLRARLVVTRKDGSTVEGALVRISSAANSPTAFEIAGAQRLQTDGEGVCALPPLAPGIRIALTVTTTDSHLLPLAAPSWEPRDQTLVLPPADVLSGRVVDASKQPVANATVWIRARPGTPTVPQDGLRWWRDPEGFVLGAITDPEGAFAVEQLPPGTLDVRATYPRDDGSFRSSETVVAETGAREVVLELAAER